MQTRPTATARRCPPQLCKISFGFYSSAMAGCPVVKVYAARLSAMTAFAWPASPSGTSLHGWLTHVCTFSSLPVWLVMRTLHRYQMTSSASVLEQRTGVMWQGDRSMQAAASRRLSTGICTARPRPTLSSGVWCVKVQYFRALPQALKSCSHLARGYKIYCLLDRMATPKTTQAPGS